MKRWLHILFLCLGVQQSYLATGSGQCAFRVDFINKNGTPFSLSTPSAYLSSRALLRRSNQSIAIDSTDLPVNPAYVDSVMRLTGGVLHEVSKWENLMVVLVSDSDTVGITTLLLSQDFIRNVQVVGYYAPYLHYRMAADTLRAVTDTAARTTGTDAGYFGQTWGQTQMIGGNCLYDKGYTGEGKMIAVLDAGFIGLDVSPFGFDSLRSSGRIVDAYNFSYGKSRVYEQDDHGTQVLSTMAAYVPDTFVGAAPLAQYALYVTEIEPSEQPLELINMLCGMERADSIGADIITSSLGYNTFDDPVYNFVFATDLDGKTTLAAKAANKATQKGMLLVITAGNEGHDSWNNILTPGDADSALTVGNVDPYGNIAYTSGFGPNAAGRVKPDVCAQGEPANVVVSTGYTVDDGTSFATPQLAGWAACLWQANPTATPYQLRAAIDHCGSLNTAPQDQYGYGIANFCCAQNMLDSIRTLQSKDSWVRIYPNPVGDEINLYLNPNASEVHVRIANMLGQVYWDGAYSLSQASLITLPASGMPPGIYIAEISAGTLHNVSRITRL